MQSSKPNFFTGKGNSDFLKEAGLENLINNIPVAVYCCDIEGNIVFFNEKAVELWGRRPNQGEELEKFCGSFKIFTLDGSYLPNDQCPMAKVIINKIPALKGEIVIERPDKTWVYAKANIQSLKDSQGKVIGAINTLLDVSAEMELNIAYKSTMENFRFLADFIPQLVWMAKPNGDIDYYNDNWFTFTHLTPEDLKSGGINVITHPEDIERVNKEWKFSLAKKESFYATARLKRGVDQAYRWFLIRATPMKDSKGEVGRWFGTCTDVHDEKRIELELKEKNEKLAKANIDLLKINNHLDTFIYTASHDLKSPISNIEGLINDLSNSIKEETLSKNEINETIKYIYSSIEKFKSTITNLTEIAKIEKNLNNDIDFKEINLSNLMNDVIHDLSQEIKNNNAIINTDFHNFPSIYFSKANLKSILYNLVSNGIKYHHTDRAPVIEIKSEKAGNSLILSITDNGLGMKENMTDKIFQLFKRFHTHVEGTGVGLYIVKKIVENEDGKIEVKTTEDRGTTFKIYLPIK